jgi:ankyrin repeat protein
MIGFTRPTVSLTALALILGLATSPHASARVSSAVADAAMAGNAEAVRTLLREGADVNAAQGDGMTALHWAAMQGHGEMAEMLLYAGANVRALTRLGGYLPLHLASQKGAADIVTALLAAGAPVDAVTATGATPLMLAAASGSAEAVTVLLDKGADINAVDAANGTSALMFAAAQNRVEAVRALLARGADWGITAKVTDLTALAREPELDIETRGAGAPPPPASDEVPGVTRAFRFIELIGKQGGLTALHLAARQGHTDSARALLDAGADVNQASPADGMTALLIASINGHFDLAWDLLERGADPTAAADNGVTPLYAVLNVQWQPRSFYPQPRAYQQQRHSYLELMKALLDKGADPNARVNRKVWYTQYNFDLLRVDEGGATPFWRAAYASDIEAMKMLRAYGADPQIPTMRHARARRLTGSHGPPAGSARRPGHPGAARRGGRGLRRGIRR